MLKVCTWNVNGIRSFPKPFKPQLDSLEADIICFQETKAGRDLSADYSRIEGYNAYFSSCKSRPSYSGVCIYCKEPIRPVKAFDGLYAALREYEEPPELQEDLDSEGRVVVLQFETDIENKLLTVISVYCPHVKPELPERLIYKMRFLDLLGQLVRQLIASKSFVILAGDFNICHKPIDHCCPTDYMSLDIEPIQWLDTLLTNGENDSAMVDVFRYAHPKRREAFTCWSTLLGARKTNYGTRIDYILYDRALADLLPPSGDPRSADIIPEQEGSDHCPVWALLPLSLPRGSDSPLPTLCSHFWPQCQKRQLQLSGFLKRPVEGGSVSSSQESVSAQAGRGALFPKKVSIGSRKTKQTRLDFVPAKPKEASVASEVTRDNQEAEPPADESLSVAALEAEIERRKAVRSAWRSLLSGARPERRASPPLCLGHAEPCVNRRVRRPDSKHVGREFWACARPVGAPGNPDARCDTFIWKQ